MADPGPLRMVDLVGGGQAPFYAAQYDKRGASTSPRTNDHMVDALRTGEFTDLFVFSHGWNNDWGTALDRYESFIRHFAKVHQRTGASLGRPFRPLLCGVFWPSTILVKDSERGPDLAAGGAPQPDEEAALAAALDDLAEALPEGSRDRVRELAEKPALDGDEAQELATLLVPVYAQGDPDLDEGGEGRDADALMEAWRDLERGEAPSGPAADPYGFGTPGAAPGAGPEAAGLFGLNPRDLIRGLTVFQMKDRAGTVGTAGVGPLLRRCLDAAPDVKVHVIGHSYGARVVLNAVARPDGGPLPRPVDSMLLLQAAVNFLCFAESLPGRTGTPGGYRAALAKVRQPILTTFSSHDQPLTKVFHIALRRRGDLGESAIAAVAGERRLPQAPSSKYSALGGYGPRGPGVTIKVDACKPAPAGRPDPSDEYALGPGAPEIWALDGEETVDGHGDVTTDATAWALVSLVRNA